MYGEPGRKVHSGKIRNPKQIQNSNFRMAKSVSLKTHRFATPQGTQNALFWSESNAAALLSIDFQKIHFARQQGEDHTAVYLRPITQRNYFSE
jgi:hypothetical protein